MSVDQISLFLFSLIILTYGPSLSGSESALQSELPPMQEEPKERAHDFVVGFAQEDPIAFIKPLLEEEFYIDEPVNSKADTLFHLAAIQTPPNFIEFLLENEADPWIKNHEGHPPANYAIYYGNLEFLQALKAHGVELQNKGLLLNFACFCGQDKIFEWLRDEAGAPLTDVEKNGATALHLAAWGGHVDIMKQLVGVIDVNARQKNGDTPLISAAWNGRVAAVKFLLEHGADVNAQGHDEHTPLWSAVAQGKIDVVKVLLEAGADPNIGDQAGSTPLHIDIGRGAWEGMPELLLSAKIDLNKSDQNGTTPLFFAALLGNATLARVLLERGADPNLQDRHGFSPLHIAGLHGYLDMGEVLLEFGAKLLKDRDDNTALHIALMHGRGAFVESVFSTAKFEIDPDMKNKAGDRLVHLASFKNQLGALEVILSKGGDIHYQNEKGDTPLHIAASNGFSAIVRTLLREGADINIYNKAGLTPYCYARSSDANLGSLITKLDLNGEMCPWEYETNNLKESQKAV